MSNIYVFLSERIQAFWRGYKVRCWYKKIRENVAPNDPRLRKAFFEQKVRHRRLIVYLSAVLEIVCSYRELSVENIWNVASVNNGKNLTLFYSHIFRYSMRHCSLGHKLKDFHVLCTILYFFVWQTLKK